MKPKDDCLQKSQLKLWFQGIRQLNSPIFEVYLQVVLLTGPRRNELTRLKWDDIDFKWNTINIRDKAEGRRIIPLTPYVAKLLNQLPRKSIYVFSSQTSASGYITEPRIAHNKALICAGLPHITIQGLRRSFGTLGEWVDLPVGVSAQIMGHKASAIAEKHYRVRTVEFLNQWHSKIERFILDEAGINFY